MEAWLIIWRWGGDHAKVDQPIAGILPAVCSAERVRAVVEALYQYEYSTTDEKAVYANNPRDNPYPAKIYDREEIICGHNPHLEALRVSDLKVTETQDLDNVTWVEVRANGKQSMSMTVKKKYPR